MGNKSKGDDEDLLSESKVLPDVAFLLIRKSDKRNTEVLHLDDMSPSHHKEYYMEAITKYGQDNVRYCKVLAAAVKVEVDFLDG